MRYMHTKAFWTGQRAVSAGLDSKALGAGPKGRGDGMRGSPEGILTLLTRVLSSVGLRSP